MPFGITLASPAWNDEGISSLAAEFESAGRPD
jgi:Asp-tRNA(Asn)/Glu-tRNA(Gln) amidotransferase A subunit family amidase